jgi:hypothetical protein
LAATFVEPLTERSKPPTTPNDQWQPSIAVTPDGSHVGIFWYDRRLDPANNLIDRFGVIGNVSGHTVNFGANFRITDVSFPPAFNQDPVWGASGYMCDYDMATADNNYFYTTWGDNRLSDAFFANQPDARFARVPVGGETDPSLVVGGTRSVAGISAAGLSSDGSLNDSASLLINAINSMAATTSASPSPAPRAIPGGPNTQPAPVWSPAAPKDAGVGEIPDSPISRLAQAAAMNALDLVFAGEGEDGLSDGLSLAVIGS